MLVKVYQKYLIKEFLTISFKITFIFFVLGFIMGILEEMEFFSEYDVKFYYPLFLVLINIPSLLYEIFPFIFLLSSQFFFLKILENGELIAFKNHGLDNSKIIKLVSLVSFISGILIITFFYNLSAELKFKYLDIKKSYTKDNKYLASITENGLWIKDENDQNINFVNAQKFTINNLNYIDIIQLNKNFEFIRKISAEKANIESNTWRLQNLIIIDKQNEIIKKNSMNFQSNFNYQDISSLFSNLSSLNIWRLLELRKAYISINYSTTEIDYHIQKMIAYPFFITIISLLSAILMMNINYQKPKLFLIVVGILISVLIYYINFFFGTMGKNEKIPLIISVWIPLIILVIISLIGLVRINEK